MRDPDHIAFFTGKVPFYRSCAKLRPIQEEFRLLNGEFHIRADIPLHGVVL